MIRWVQGVITIWNVQDILRSHSVRARQVVVRRSRPRPWGWLSHCVESYSRARF